MKRTMLLLTLSCLLFSCASIPKGAVAVRPFDKTKYLGTWYEICRMDFKYERDLNNTTATYSLREDGKIKVDNKGFDTIKNTWDEAIGKAKFAGSENVAELRVSFFGPFYSGYNVIAIDANYTYALVAGESHKYLWILSREKTIPEEIRNNYLTLASDIGYDTSALVWVAHNK